MDRLDLQLASHIVVEYGKESELAHETWRKKLGNEALVLEILHREIECLSPVGTRYIRKPQTILVRRSFADAANVLPHGKTQRVRINPRIVRAVIRRLMNDIGM